MSCTVPKSKSAVFSGYLMAPDKFKEFACSLPTPRPWEREGYTRDPFVPQIQAYCYWRRRLDPKKRKYFPMIRARYAADDNEPSVTEDRITHMFFATRFVPYKGPSQMNESHPNSKRLRTETEKDRALLNLFKQVVESDGAKFDQDMVTFGTIRDWHPAHDPYSF
ncbi:hypothetical protein OE88DRAFT_1665850 [Heliocybe sulcata]|uniref:Uncharacterized protein n=1 Tax=Heliocybe sulcata TaxID=5364 RepID=A0A5C3MRG0_9AGAM|nr:hypothetical protein OE88DRAFT_1665850 [Heliocybe sulcata]